MMGCEKRAPSFFHSAVVVHKKQVLNWVLIQRKNKKKKRSMNLLTTWPIKVSKDHYDNNVPFLYVLSSQICLHTDNYKMRALFICPKFTDTPTVKISRGNSRSRGVHEAKTYYGLFQETSL